jgi:hypothetical protein
MNCKIIFLAARYHGCLVNSFLMGVLLIRSMATNITSHFASACGKTTNVILSSFKVSITAARSSA